MSAPTTPLLPTSERVLRAWLLGISGMPPNGVATELPADQTAWSDKGFVTFLGLGGRPSTDLAVRMPIFQVDCWAVSPTSGKPPWNKANQLAELIVAATYEPSGPVWGIRGIDVGPNYRRARVMAAQVTSEPRRYLQDQGALARYTLDLQLTYVAVA